MHSGSSSDNSAPSADKKTVKELFVVNGFQGVRNENPANVRRNLWALTTQNAKELLETALKNLNTDPMAMAASVRGQEHVDRLVLDYMFARNECTEDHGDSTLMENVDRYAINFFVSGLTSSIILSEGFVLRIHQAITADKSVLLASLNRLEDNYVKALALNVAADPNTGLGKPIAQNRHFFTLHKCKPTEGQYGEVYDAAEAAKQAVFDAFLEATKDKQGFSQIRDKLLDRQTGASIAAASPVADERARMGNDSSASAGSAGGGWWSSIFSRRVSRDDAKSTDRKNSFDSSL
jgi:hypothetical protein